ncbi:MAG: hypothetical protein AAFZ04_08045 [Pseudomonadota bacterium]
MKKITGILTSVFAVFSVTQASASVDPAPTNIASTSWEAAAKDGSAKALVNYILENPDSPHLEDARRLLSTVDGTINPGLAQPEAEQSKPVHIQFV